MPTAELTEAETRALIAAFAEKRDLFSIKVMRRRGNGAQPEILATFDGGKAAHLGSPETWLPLLAGGGSFTIHATHDTEPMKYIGSGIQVLIDGTPPRKVDLNAAKRPDWNGPSDMTYPLPPPQQQQPDYGTRLTSVENGIDIGPPPGTTPIGITKASSADPLTALLAQAQQSEARAHAQVQRAEFERNLEGVRREYDAKLVIAQRQHDELMAELRRMREDTASAKNRPPEKPLTDTLAALAAALAPIIAPFVTGLNDTKIRMMEIEAKRSAEQLSMQQNANQRMEQLTNTLLTSLTNKPAIDPTLLAMISKEKETNPAMAQMVNSMSGMMNMFITSITAATDAGLIGQQQGGGWQDVVKEVAGAAGGFFEMLGKQHEVALAQAQGRPARVIQPGPPPQQLPVRQPVQQQRQPQAQMNTLLSPLKQLDQMVRRHHDPMQTARFFLESVQKDGEVRQNFIQSGSDIEEFFKFHWGTWAMSNAVAHYPYVQQLRAAVDALATQMGLVKQEAASSATVETATVPNGSGHASYAARAAAEPVDPGDERLPPSEAEVVEVPTDGEGEGEEEEVEH